MSKQKNLDIIKKYQKEIILLGQAGALLDWDHQTYMPKKAAESRAEQSAIISALLHQKMTSEEFFHAVEALKKETLDARTTRLVEKIHKDLMKSRTLPQEFVEELSKTTSLAFHAWQESRKKNDFKIFLPHLEKVIMLKQKQADYYNTFLHFSNRYDALIDDYEEGMTVKKLEPFFIELKKGLLALLTKIKKSKHYTKQKENMLKGTFDRAVQMEYAHDVFKRIGLTEELSRIDFAEHPFETRIGMNDIRITTNIRPDPLFSFGSTIHEAGHALYELHLSQEGKYDFLESSPSYGMHESQSRFWELFVGGSRAFWKYYFPLFAKKFHLKGNFEEWYKEIHIVKPSLIRIESDEVHYSLHIILRFELEKGLLDGTIKVKDLPQLWNKKMQEYFGITPENDHDGVLQDVHWSGGSVGYFPSYALGTVYASQLFAQMEQEIPSIEKNIQKGNFSNIREWLRKKVHTHGSMYYADELIKKVTGNGLDPQTFLKYLEKKYSQVYNL